MDKYVREDVGSKLNISRRGRGVYELITKEAGCEEYHKGILDDLRDADEQVYGLIEREYQRQRDTIQLLAAENRCSRAVLAALGSVVQNKTAEGFVGAREHGGCEVIDDIEQLAIARAKEAFGAKYANVQPHCGTAANQIVLTAVLERSGKILSMGLEQGGHYSHGAGVSFTGRFFDVENYHVNKERFLLDYDAIREQAIKVRPRLIICGASAYSRTIDFKRFRKIADDVGAYLLADISHISGLVMAGAHPSPVDYAHFTTTSTYKSGGPRGGLILMGPEYDMNINVKGEDVPLWRQIENATFPGMQGTVYLNNLVAKAVFFKETLTEEYKIRQFKIIENAKRLASDLVGLGYDVLTGGTDNHMALVNAANYKAGLTGIIAQRCLEECGIIVDAINLPYNEVCASAASGIRLGTAIVTKMGMGAEEMDAVAAMIDAVLKKAEIISDSEYEIEASFKEQMRNKVRQLCNKFPMG